MSSPFYRRLVNEIRATLAVSGKSKRNADREQTGKKNK
jgi:hypothetical protein